MARAAVSDATCQCIALLYGVIYAAVRSAGTAAPDSLARYVASSLIYAAACAAALNWTAMPLALLYAAVPSAGDGASDQQATMICYTLVYASVCGTGADAAVGLATILCHAQLYSLACHVGVAEQGSFVRYEALRYAAAGCAYAAAPNEIAWYLALTYAAAGLAWAAALESLRTTSHGSSPFHTALIVFLTFADCSYCFSHFTLIHTKRKDAC